MVNGRQSGEAVVQELQQQHDLRRVEELVARHQLQVQKQLVVPRRLGRVHVAANERAAKH